MKRSTKQPTPLQKANNQIHILQTTVKELQEKLESNRIALERRDRIVLAEVDRCKRLGGELIQIRTELANLKKKWYVRWFS